MSNPIPQNSQDRNGADALWPSAPSERVSVNFAEKLVTIDNEDVFFVGPSGLEAYPNMVRFFDGSIRAYTFEAVNEYGDAQHVNGMIHNYVEPKTDDDEEDEEKVDEAGEAEKASGVITLPTDLRLRVRHIRRGPGTVRKVRDDADGKRSLYIEYDRSILGQKQFCWALNTKIRNIETY